jgi:hypothetical protein
MTVNFFYFDGNFGLRLSHNIVRVHSNYSRTFQQELIVAAAPG